VRLTRALRAQHATTGPHHARLSPVLPSRQPYRLTADRLIGLRRALAAFKGTHAYHNFTPQLKVGDATTVRYVTDVAASEPFLIGDDEEYVHLTIVGQSFLLNQIRHMVGLAADVAAGAAPPQMSQWVFSPGEIKLPLAPAEGLYLDKCFFTAYDARFASGVGGLAGAHNTLTDLSPAATAATVDFRQTVIWKHMAQAVAAPFSAYLRDLTTNPVRYSLKFSAAAVRAVRGEGSAAAGKRTRDAAFAEPARALLETDAARAVIFDGGAVSKVAREKKEWKVKLAAEKERIRGAQVARRDAKAQSREDGDAAAASAAAPESAEPPAPLDGAASAAATSAAPPAANARSAEWSSKSFGARNRSASKGPYWQGGKGRHEKDAAAPPQATTQVWRPTKKPRVFS
jgi:hypothetical protein